MAMVGYKKIVENMVEMEVSRFIESKTGDYIYAYPVDGTLKMSVDDKSLGHPVFEIDVRVNHRMFNIHGFVTEYGQVIVSSVNFERDYLIDENRDDWSAKDNINHVREFIYGDDLRTFKFDR